MKYCEPIIIYYKCNSPQELKDLHPISILCTLSKVLESVMEQKIRKFLDKYEMRPSCQSGFRSNYSCDKSLLNISDEIIRIIRKNHKSNIATSRILLSIRHNVRYS